jgi:hypothetical protein
VPAWDGAVGTAPTDIGAWRAVCCGRRWRRSERVCGVMTEASVRYSSSWNRSLVVASTIGLGGRTYGFDGADGAVHHRGVHLFERRHVGCDDRKREC